MKEDLQQTLAGMAPITLWGLINDDAEFRERLIALLDRAAALPGMPAKVAPDIDKVRALVDRLAIARKRC